MTKNILITGGLGYIGKITQRILNEKGIKTFVIDELPAADISQKSSFKQLSLLNRLALEQLFEEEHFDVVLHFAAKIEVAESVQRPLHYYRHNVEGTINLLEAMKKQPHCSLVFLSSAAVYSSTETLLSEQSSTVPVNPYGQSKLMAEQIIADCPWLSAIVLRLFNVAGAHSKELGENHNPETHLIPLVVKQLLDGQSVNIFGSNYPTKDGTCTRDFVHVLDVVSAIEYALQYLEQARSRVFDIYNIGSGEDHSVKEVILETAAQLQIDPKINYQPNRIGDTISLRANIHKAQEKLHWHPVHSNLTAIVKSSIDFQQVSSGTAEQ